MPTNFLREIISDSFSLSQSNTNITVADSVMTGMFCENEDVDKDDDADNSNEIENENKDNAPA